MDATKDEKNLQHLWTVCFQQEFCYRVGRGYAVHFKFEAMKDCMEHVFKKLHPVQNVGHLLPFLPRLTKSKQILLCS